MVIKSLTVQHLKVYCVKEEAEVAAPAVKELTAALRGGENEVRNSGVGGETQPATSRRKGK